MTEPNPTPTGAQPAPNPPGTSRSPVLNSATLIMGPSKSGKTSLLTTFAEWVWENFKLVTVYAGLDDGGFPTQMQSLINRGIVWYWRPKTRSGEGLTHETLQRMAQGWLPKSFNPRTGEVDPNVQMVPPVTAVYVMRCAKGHVVKSVATQQMLTPGKCPTCGDMVDLRTAKVETSVQRTKGFEKIGAMMFDGITSATQWGLDDLSKRDMGGEKSALGGMVVSGGMSFGQNNRAQVGFVQNRAQQLVSASNSIPGLVVPPVWTALTQEGSDEGGLKIRGPLLAGVAKVAVATQWFGDAIETAVATHEGKRFRRMYLQSFVDQDGVRHLCGVRSYPGMIPAILEDEDTDDPKQARFIQFNLGYFYQLREQAAAQLEAEYAQKYADAPGMAEGMMSFGEAGPSSEGSAPAPAAVGGPSGSPSLPQGQVPGVTAPRPGTVAPTAPRPGGAPAAAHAAPPAPPAQPAPPAPPAPPAAVSAPQPAARKRPAAAAAQPPSLPVAQAPAPAAPQAPTPPPPPVAPTPPPAAPVATAASPLPGAGPVTPVQAPPAVIMPPVRGLVPPPPGRRRPASQEDQE